MTRAEKKRRRRNRKIQRVCAWTVLILFELLVSAVPTALTSAILLPLAYRERGYFGVGSEWLLIIAIFCITYSAFHNRICDKIFKEG